jgi:hypothetical protein
MVTVSRLCQRHRLQNPDPAGPQLTLTARVGNPLRRPDDPAGCPDCAVLGDADPESGQAGDSIGSGSV